MSKKQTVPIQGRAIAKQLPVRNVVAFSRREEDKNTIFVENMPETVSVNSEGCDPMPKQRVSIEKHIEKLVSLSEPSRSSNAKRVPRAS